MFPLVQSLSCGTAECHWSKRRKSRREVYIVNQDQLIEDVVTKRVAEASVSVGTQTDRCTTITVQKSVTMKVPRRVTRMICVPFVLSTLS